MLNLTHDKIIFRKSGRALNKCIRSALSSTSIALMKIYGVNFKNQEELKQSKDLEAYFPKYVAKYVLPKKRIFGQEFVLGMWHFYQTPSAKVTKEHFDALIAEHENVDFRNLHQARRHLKRGLGLALLNLHSLEAITLPSSFYLSAALPKSAADHGLFSELLTFVRSLTPDATTPPHTAFACVFSDRKKREWFLSYGTKALLSTGWNKPQDANIKDLITIRKSDNHRNIKDSHGFKLLIDVLSERYGSSLQIRPEDWTLASRNFGFIEPSQPDVGIYEESLLSADHKAGNNDELNILRTAIQMSPTAGRAESINYKSNLEGAGHSIANDMKKWLDLQAIFMRTIKRESMKSVEENIGYFNNYLAYYIHPWLNINKGSKLKFPDAPSKLNKNHFISRLLQPDGKTLPITFIEFLEKVAQHRQWANVTHYAHLKQVQIFFQFLEDYHQELKGCRGFLQPIPPHAFPNVSRSKGTNKRPIPRRLFIAMLDYIEAIKSHQQAIIDRIHAGHLDGFKLATRLKAYSRGSIDTFAIADLVGFIPVIYIKNNITPLRLIPNCLCMANYNIPGKGKIHLPQPHALNQILCALYTGLRHNHIQWLDERYFDKDASLDNVEFSKLYVNTDKSMTRGWSPNVNMRVIEILRDQQSWRNQIKSNAFSGLHFYNNTEKTKWPKILPLFSIGASGKPHNDQLYEKVWSKIICGMDAIRSLIDEQIPRLAVLEPPWVEINDPQARQKRFEYGLDKKTVCNIYVKSKIVPHSARVTVISQYSTILPPDLIGKNFTGQKPAAVNHYVVLDAEDLEIAQAHQALTLRRLSNIDLTKSFEAMKSGKPHYIKADTVNSNLSKSFRQSSSETIASYGCVSIVLNDSKSNGVDILRTKFAAEISFNKTEICPYGNNCPPDIIKNLKGLRRCGLCNCAVRSVDHLPAVSAKVKQFAENLDYVSGKIEAHISGDLEIYTDDEIDLLEVERYQIAEELAGWKLSEEVLYGMLERVAKSQDQRTWFVEKPEIILKHLKRMEIRTSSADYLMARLAECIAFPMSETPVIRARLDIVRRKLLAGVGDISEAFKMDGQTSSAYECAGVIIALLKAHQISFCEFSEIIENKHHISIGKIGDNQILPRNQQFY